MKPLMYALPAAAWLLAGCGKSDNTTPAPTPAPAATGVFTAKIAGDAYSAPDSSYLFNGAGNAIAIFSKDSKGRGFQMALFEKDFPVNTAVGVAYSPAVAYRDATGALYIPKSGTMTVTEYGKASSGTVNRMAGSFSVVVTSDQKDIEITEGRFDVKTR